MTIIVSCARDNELAERLYHYLLLRIASVNDISERGAAEFISHNADEIEIRNEEVKMERSSIREAVDDFVSSDSGLAGYSVTEFGDIPTIGIRQSLSSVVLACEMCGYIAAHEDDLRIHKMTHGLL
jgi:hypothetical protein